MNSGSYLIDNVKLHRISTGTGEKTLIPFIVNCYNNYIQLNRVAERIEIFDISGRLLLTRNNVAKVNVHQFTQGIYLVKAFINGETFLSKVIK
jgi:hypothetical protein